MESIATHELGEHTMGKGEVNNDTKSVAAKYVDGIFQLIRLIEIGLGVSGIRIRLI